MLRYGSPHSIVQQPHVRRHTNRSNRHVIPPLFRSVVYSSLYSLYFALIWAESTICTAMTGK